MTDIEKYEEIQKELKNYRYATFILSFDQATVCPKKDKENSLNVINSFERKMIDITTSDDYFNLLQRLLEKKESLNDIQQMAIAKEYKDLEKMRRVPKEVLFEGMKISSKASLSWELARDNLDYSAFEKNLADLVAYHKKYISYVEDKYHGYDVLLDEMEDDFTEEKYDIFFDKLEQEILPLMKTILSLPKRYNEQIKELRFDVDKQKKLTKKICELMGYTDEVGYIGETIHPFTSGGNIHDVRTTTRYDEKLLFSNLYSVMHEVGHALYELQNDEQYNETCLMGGASCALHESQSRFYENYLGRSKAFITFLYPILKEIFPEELKEYTLEDIYYYCNDVCAQPTRTEADELTYPFHVLIRYKIEKMLFHNEIESKDIEKVFNHFMQEYFGITPKNKLEGCFQDVHWSGGFGYFPTYALGSAMSAQFYYAMKKDLNMDALLRNGDFKPINLWLKGHVHCYGASKKNLEILSLATKEEFNPDYYIRYLKEKFEEIYQI